MTRGHWCVGLQGSRNSGRLFYAVSVNVRYNGIPEQSPIVVSYIQYKGLLEQSPVLASYS